MTVLHLNGRSGRAKSLAASAIVVLLVSLVVSMLADSGPAAGMNERRVAGESGGGTPVAVTPPDSPAVADPLDGDPAETEPLDGDPLDGNPDLLDVERNDNRRIEIVRSGRPSGAPRSVVAYDNNPDSFWGTDETVDDPWLWVDLGEEFSLREVHLLARGGGEIELSVSNDRRTWQEVDRISIAPGWAQVELREDARYVRFSLFKNDEGKFPEIAEVSAYGQEQQSDVSQEQKGKRDKERNKDRSRKQKAGNDKRDKDDSGGNQSTDDKNNKSNNKNGKDSNGSGSRSADGISVEAGETRCDGDRERCRARAGKVSVEDDCGTGSSCTIDIQADGGTAICDASGGSRAEAGDGEGRRNGDGGRCEAVANGGAVSIGDVNP